MITEVTSHALKTWPEYFQAVLERRKTFEIRKNDRDFQVGDYLHLMEMIPENGKFTGASLNVRVTYMTAFSQPEGQVVLGIEFAEEP
jgi:hypothetical protein